MSAKGKRKYFGKAKFKLKFFEMCFWGKYYFGEVGFCGVKFEKYSEWT